MLGCRNLPRLTPLLVLAIGLAGWTQLRECRAEPDSVRTGLPGEASQAAPAPALPPALEKTAPETLDDLRAIERALGQVATRALDCTVGIAGPGTRGSGVIVSADGLVVTAAHVSGGTPGQRLRVVLADGRSVSAVTLGAGLDADLGLVRITESGNWPHAELGNSAPLERGAWCVATGHPGGFERDRPPVVRTGRVLSNQRRTIRSDCSIASGDSGGPLFDATGRVVGIHSRIGLNLDGNYHIPIDLFRENWERLENSELWGGERVVIGVRGETTSAGCVVTEVLEGLPAARAGLLPGDRLLRVNGAQLTNWDGLTRALSRHRAGERVIIEFERGLERLSVQVALSTMP
ncbi:MAG: S1C family serine protease [Planctomycetota bacterium]